MDGKDTKTQKAGLNAVRPDEYTEEKFKTMAKEHNLSQTEMFKRIFYSYLSENRKEAKNEALNCESELSLIAKDLDNILNNIKGITTKAQDKIISIKSNAEQTENNLETDIDTLKKKVEALEKRNNELEKSNEAFTEIRESLEESITVIRDNLTKKEADCKEIKKENQEKDKAIHNLEKQAEVQLKEYNTLQKDKARQDEETETKISKIHNLEITNSSLQAAISNMEIMKRAEIAAIEAKHQAVITELRSKLEAYDERKKEEIKTATSSLRTEMESDKKLAIAEIKLELAGVKEKLAETMTNQYTREKIQGKKQKE